MTYLQNIYAYQRLLALGADGAREIERATLPEGVGPHFAGQYASYNDTYVGVRPSDGGPVYFNGDKEILLAAEAQTGKLTRGDSEVVFELYRGDELLDPTHQLFILDARRQGLPKGLEELCGGVGGGQPSPSGDLAPPLPLVRSPAS